MKIKNLWIESFKNLKHFRIDFDPSCMTTVLLGENGTGKSNLLESLVIIFRDLDLAAQPAFAYRLEYGKSQKSQSGSFYTPISIRLGAAGAL